MVTLRSNCSDLESRMDRVGKIFVRGREWVCLLCGCRKKFVKACERDLDFWSRLHH